MNNEEKRFKQINRIAKPIQVNPNDNNVNNQQPINNIPPKETKKKKKKKITKANILTMIIILLGILIVGALIFLVIIIKPENKNTSLKYNDATTPTTTKVNDNTFINYTQLVEGEKIDFASSYNVNNFNLSLNSSGSSLEILVNSKKITSANYLVSKVGFVDDLIMFTVGNNDTRTTTFYVVDSLGNIIYDIYNYSEIDGMVLIDNNAVNYNPTSVILSMSRVNNNLIYNSNSLGNNHSANICDEDSLFKNSIETQKPIRINYSLEYLGNHRFSNPSIIYEEYLNDYKSNNNLCN